MNDLISRQAAIDFIDAGHLVNPNEPRWSDNEVVNFLKSRPSAQPSSKDPIEREAVVDILHDAMQNRSESEENLIGEIVCKVDLLPSVQPEQRWISCSERLPENNRQVLVYARSVHFALAKYDEMRNANGIYEMQWVTFDAWKPFYKIKEVIAWMPLPEPYR